MKVLIIFSEKNVYLGDTLIKIDKLSLVYEFFKKAKIDLNFSDSRYNDLYKGLIKNNPYINVASFCSWNTINFLEYDVVVCMSWEELEIATFFDKQYEKNILCRDSLPVFFSLTQLVLNPKDDPRVIFDTHYQLQDFIINSQKKFIPRELFIDDGEREQGNKWLESKGIKNGDSLYVFCDSSSREDKLINREVYFKILNRLLKNGNVKILIFDEKGIDKESYYKTMVTAESFNKLIFSKCQTLRNDLALISSKYVKLVFGPCTGLMHCASAIYNNLIKRGSICKSAAPAIIVYTGMYSEREKNAKQWWSNSPLVSCIFLKRKYGNKYIAELPQNNQVDISNNCEQIDCAQYDFDLLYDYIFGKLKNNTITLH